MFLLDKPYISDFLKKTLKEEGIPVVHTETASGFELYDGTDLVPEEEAAARIRQGNRPRIYMTSENAIEWAERHLGSIDIPEKIRLFKNKAAFRRLTRNLFPGFAFREVELEGLRDFNCSDFPLPFIVKPAVGFFSMGVYQVTARGEWNGIVQSIGREIDALKGIYPDSVLDTGTFLVEQCIFGEEFAVDAYFDGDGEPVIVGIYKHIFSSEQDVSDRVYSTSAEIVRNNLEEFTSFTGEIGRAAGVRNFPVHIELRRDSSGNLLPIEVNPMRFGGWCTTADCTFHAFGFNPYVYYYRGLKPNWPELLRGKDGNRFSIIVLDNSTGISERDIVSFDYEALCSCFEHLIELRKIDWKEYPVFGFLFVETPASAAGELERILHSNLREFVTISQ
jgi:hypothetical protein